MKNNLQVFRFIYGFLGTSAVTLAVLSGCAKSSTSNDPAPVTPASPLIGQSITTAPAINKTPGKMVLQKSALMKAFLLRAQMKQSTNTTTWNDLKPLVVSFQKDGNQLGLFAVNSLQSYDVVDSSKLVATFPVLSEDDQSLTFEWTGGFKILFDAPYDSPEDATVLANQQGGNTAAVQTSNSFVTEAGSIKGNIFHVRESNTIVVTDLRPKSDAEKAQNPDPTPVFETETQSIVVDYRLAPYIPNPSFVKKAADPFRKFGFFTVSVGIDSQSTTAQPLAAHWDMSPGRGPIVYKISKYFPSNIAQAVKEGVEYWNLAMGEGSVKVVTGVDPEGDFDDRSVMINWLPWTDAGASWADMEINPLTGELINGQIYITSVFLDISPRYPVATLQVPQSLSVKSPTARSEARFKLVGSGSTTTCRFPTEGLVLSQELTNNVGILPRATYLNDEIRHVVAHEVGHTLGLRHNFAGSFDSVVSAHELDRQKLSYATDASYDGAEASTSIMDYIGGLEEGMIGRYILHHPLKYDQAAQAWVRDANSNSENSTLNYCTDEDITTAGSKDLTTTYGCQRFDAPGNPFNVGREEISRVLGTSVSRKLESLVKAIVKGTAQNKPFDAILQADFVATAGALDASKYATNNFNLLWNFLTTSLPGPVTNKVQGLSEVGTALWNAKPAPSISPRVLSDLKELGGLAGLIKLFLPTDADGNLDAAFYQRQLSDILASPTLASGVTGDGVSYSLSDEQQAKVTAYLQKAVDGSLNQVLAAVLINFKDENFIFNDVIDADQQMQLAELMSAISNWKNGTVTYKVQGKDVVIPKSTLPAAYRLVTTLAMNPIHYSKGSTASSAALRSYLAATRPVIENELRTVLGSVKLATTDMALPKQGATGQDYSSFVTSIAGKAYLSDEANSWAQDEVKLLLASDLMAATLATEGSPTGLTK
jgi:hypothetical protein